MISPRKRKRLFIQCLQAAVIVFNVKQEGTVLFCVWPLLQASQIQADCLPIDLRELEEAVWSFLDYMYEIGPEPDWLEFEEEEKDEA